MPLCVWRLIRMTYTSHVYETHLPSVLFVIRGSSRRLSLVGGVFLANKTKKKGRFASQLAKMGHFSEFRAYFLGKHGELTEIGDIHKNRRVFVNCPSFPNEKHPELKKRDLSSQTGLRISFLWAWFARENATVKGGGVAEGSVAHHKKGITLKCRKTRVGSSFTED